MSRLPRCKDCKQPITPALRSLKGGVCLDCRFAKYRQPKTPSKPRPPKTSVIRPVVIYRDGDEWEPSNTVPFCGYDFNDANVCPVR